MHAAEDSSKVESTLHMRYTFSSICSSTSRIQSLLALSSSSIARCGASEAFASRTFQNLCIM